MPRKDDFFVSCLLRWLMPVIREGKKSQRLPPEIPRAVKYLPSLSSRTIVNLFAHFWGLGLLCFCLSRGKGRLRGRLNCLYLTIFFSFSFSRGVYLWQASERAQNSDEINCMNVVKTAQHRNYSLEANRKRWRRADLFTSSKARLNTSIKRKMAFELCINWSVGSLVYVNFPSTIFPFQNAISTALDPSLSNSTRVSLLPSRLTFIHFTDHDTNCEKMDFSSRSLFFAGCCLQMDPQLLFSFFFCFAARPLRKQTLRRSPSSRNQTADLRTTFSDFSLKKSPVNAPTTAQLCGIDKKKYFSFLARPESIDQPNVEQLILNWSQRML